MSANDGGPAFPESYIGDQVPHEGIGGGMSLRDYFAAKAMQAMVSNTETMNSTGGDPDGMSKVAYFIADAMLAAREVKA